jgi:glycerol uptake facilitator protein
LGVAVFSVKKKGYMLMASLAPSRSNFLSGTYGECIAEFFGTMVLILFGDGCVASFALFTKFVPVDWNLITFGWGFAVMLGVYVAGTVSGAHINPAVTFALAVRGKFSWNKVAPYWVSQVLGAFVGALVLYLVYQGAINNALNGANITQVGGVFYTSHKPFVGVFGAFGDEFVGTLLLVGLIFAIVDARNQQIASGMTPLIIGFLVVAIGFSFGLNTGYAINPARDFGPRLLVSVVGGGANAFPSDYWWIPIVAPLLGGAVGGFIYDFTIHKVLEAKSAAAADQKVETDVSAKTATGD